MCVHTAIRVLPRWEYTKFCPGQGPLPNKTLNPLGRKAIDRLAAYQRSTDKGKEQAGVFFFRSWIFRISLSVLLVDVVYLLSVVSVCASLNYCIIRRCSWARHLCSPTTSSWCVCARAFVRASFLLRACTHARAKRYP